MDKNERRISETDLILEDIAEAVCDGMCHKLDGIPAKDSKRAQEICENCAFGKAYDEASRILKNFDAEYLKICKENDRIQRRLKLYDLYSDVS
jgi:hypothetical protein